MKETLIRYAYSSLITFGATFVAVAVPQLLDGSFEWTTGALVGLFIATVRLGFKAAWENLRPLIPVLLAYAKNLLKK